MVFNSIFFCFLFFPISYFLYLVVSKIPHINIRVENLLLVVISLVFYSYSGYEHVLILIGLIVFNYIVGVFYNKFKIKKILVFGIMANIFILIYFKYLNMIISILSDIITHKVDFFVIAAPLAISFIIFHCISYHMDVWNNNADVSDSIIDFALYLTFFPKLIQGPIVKYKDMKEELQYRKIMFDDCIEGIERIIIGLCKKVLVADYLAEITSQIFSLSMSGIDSLTAWLAVLLFSIQIYMDFSGYSDIAIGISKLFGFHFQENFNFPYISKSITEFWRRWHISLGAWFREYLYIPLGGNRRGNVYINLIIVFLVTGLWHGASLIYLGWGIYHGIFILIEKFMKKKGIMQNTTRFTDLVRICCTFLIVSIGWIAFNISNPAALLLFFKQLLNIADPQFITLHFLFFIDEKLMFVLLLFFILHTFFANDKMRKMLKYYKASSNLFHIFKYCAMLLLCILIFISMITNTYTPFLYFQY
ncbi:hypothetical protein MKC54_03785 [[Clostridium] innocuum]|nr:hypothetical protein [[Clostridium] innocuum]MCR0575996.1 hypothetical protein [[Clostridium] innocuum]